MTKGQKKEYNRALSQRISELIDISGLSISAFADFIHISESHLYAILNGNRNVAPATLDKIKEALPFKVGDFTLLSRKISKRNIDFTNLNNFKDENKFRLKQESDLSLVIENELMKNGSLFKNSVTTGQIRLYLKQAGKTFSSKMVSQKLEYLVIQGRLNKKQEAMKLKNGEIGKRQINYYFKTGKK